MQDSVKERLILFIKSQNLSQGKFERLLGFSNGYVNNISKGIGGDKLQRIIGAFPDLNTEWLLTGVGDMINKSSSPDLESMNMSREVFEKISKLIDTVCSQQNTIADQHRTIDRLVSSQKNSSDVRPADNADSAVAG
ncbi:hypothetical protein [uncultured Alistipes sp.]|uniref:helix-turn-helix domain-containing protein n=1 Tax=uncultured Alistipes sp. TaxID=538949 RepID=UPI00259464C9|nr:hypothetical protein [uncultured Alistipes sp.]